MFRRVRILAELTQDTVVAPAARLGRAAAGRARTLAVVARRERVAVTLLAVLAGMAFGIARHPPLQSVGPGEMVVRRNRVTGEVRDFRHGNLVALPGVHEVRRYSLREQVYRTRQNASVAAGSESPFRTAEGLPLSVEVAVRYAIDPTQVAALAGDLPGDLGVNVLRPALGGVVARVFGGYTAREVISTRRADIEQALAAQLRPRLAAAGLRLHGVELSNLDLPPAGRAAAERQLLTEFRVEQTAFSVTAPELPAPPAMPSGRAVPARAPPRHERNPLRIDDTLALKLPGKLIAPPPTDDGINFATLPAATGGPTAGTTAPPPAAHPGEP